MNHADEAASQLLNEYARELRQGEKPSIEDFLARCPASARDELAQDCRAMDLLFQHHYATSVCREVVERTRSRIGELRVLKERVRQAHEDLVLSIRNPAGVGPVELMASALGLNGDPRHGDKAIPGEYSVLHRGVAGGEITSKALDRSAAELSRRFGITNAEQVLRELDVRHLPVDLQTICRYLNMVVSYQPLDNRSDGALVTDGEIGGIVINSQASPKARQRFTLAHEIGHFCMHRKTMKYVVEDLETPRNSKQEIEADSFAAALLMPSWLLGDVHSRNPRFAEIDDMADKFEVSLTAAAMRFVAVSDWACAFVVSKEGAVKWMNSSSQLYGYIPSGTDTPAGSGAAALFTDPTMEETSRRLPIGVWLPDRRSEDLTVFEDSRYVGDDYVYSLFTVEE